MGGGVAVLEALIPHLAERDDWTISVLRPHAAPGSFTFHGVTYIDLAVPILRDTTVDALVHFGERRYALFALQWEAALRAYFQTMGSSGAVVVANDVSEGPPFAWLAQHGFRQVVLYHAVVADFFARQYLSGCFGVGPIVWAWGGWPQISLGWSGPRRVNQLASRTAVLSPARILARHSPRAIRPVESSVGLLSRPGA